MTKPAFDIPGPEKPSASLSATVVIFVSMAIWAILTRMQFSVDGDDAMRLVQVRDLLAGQGWFDLTQYRLGAGGGTALPLLRLADAPLAGLILLFDVFVDRTAAEALAMTVWPLVLFGMVVASLYAVCLRLGGPKAAVYGATLASIAVVQTGKFDPGSLNHGNLQLALFMFAVVGFVMRRTSLAAAGLGGASAALSLAIGPEVAAQIIVIFIAHALVWGVRGRAEQRSTLVFAASAVGAAGLIVAAGPAAQTACAAVPVTAVLGVGTASAVLAVFLVTASTRPRPMRLGLLAVLGVAMLALFWLRAVQCPAALGAVDAMIKERWLDHVMDTKSVSGLAPDTPGVFIGYGVGWLISVWFVFRDVRRDPWSLLCVLLGVTLVMTAYRGHTSAVLSMLSILPTSIFAARMIARSKPDAGIWKSVAVIAVLLMSIPAITGAAIAMNEAARQERAQSAGLGIFHPPIAEGACIRRGDFAGLAALGDGVILAPLELVPRILLHTPHRVVAEPFYRATAGNAEQVQGADSLRAAGITHVVHCRRGGRLAADHPALAGAIRRGVNAQTLRAMRLKKSRSLAVYQVRAP